jgi:DNA-binding transcriptional LysR family regulator
MELIKKDLNLLLVFSVIWEERNLSKAAERLFLSQSAVSHALKRLRTEFQDPLFVRDSKGVSPTEFAVALAPKVSQLLLRTEEIYSSNSSFDPKTSTRNLVLAAGDYFSVAMLERFVSELAAQAPGVQLIIRPVVNIFNLDKFETGEIHLAVTAIDIAQKEGFHFQELLRDKISICVRKDHPQIRKKISLDKYLQARHLNVSNFGLDRGVVDQHLESLDRKREVALVTSSFFDAARLLRVTDLVLSAPHQICLGLAKDYNLAVYPVPLEYQPRSISMIWHERTDKDPFHSWVRKLVLEQI